MKNVKLGPGESSDLVATQAGKKAARTLAIIIVDANRRGRIERNTLTSVYEMLGNVTSAKYPLALDALAKEAAYLVAGDPSERRRLEDSLKGILANQGGDFDPLKCFNEEWRAPTIP